MAKNIAAIVGGLFVNLLLNRFAASELPIGSALPLWLFVVAGLATHAFFLAKSKFRRRKVWIPLMLCGFATYFLLLAIEPAKSVSDILQEEVSKSDEVLR